MRTCLQSGLFALAAVVFELAAAAPSGITPSDSARREQRAATNPAISAAAGVPAAEDREAAAQRDRDRIGQAIPGKIVGLENCVKASSRCTPAELRKILLNLRSVEVEGILGAPQYHLHVANQHLDYWTVELNAGQAVSAVRVQVIYGECDYREKNSRRKAVCEVTTH